MARCARCERLLVVKPRPIPDKKTHARHKSRGLCSGCWTAARVDGTLWDYPRVTRSMADTIEDWELLRQQGYSRRQAAERLGVSKKALEHAISRARRRNVPVAG